MGFEFKFSKVAIMKLSKSISTSDLLLLCSSGFGEHNNTEHNGERVMWELLTSLSKCKLCQLHVLKPSLNDPKVLS